MSFPGIRRGVASTVRVLPGPLLVLLSLLTVVWFAPEVPYPAQDSAWVLALNQAVADHLAFGRDVLFTLGPWGTVYAGQYHPATDGMMLAGGAIVALALAGGLWALATGGRRWVVLLAPVLVATVGQHDPLFLCLPVLMLAVSIAVAQDGAAGRFRVAALLLLTSCCALLKPHQGHVRHPGGADGRTGPAGLGHPPPIPAGCRLADAVCRLPRRVLAVGRPAPPRPARLPVEHAGGDLRLHRRPGAGWASERHRGLWRRRRPASDPAVARRGAPAGHRYGAADARRVVHPVRRLQVRLRAARRTRADRRRHAGAAAGRAGARIAGAPACRGPGCQPLRAVLHQPQLSGPRVASKLPVALRRRRA